MLSAARSLAKEQLASFDCNPAMILQMHRNIQFQQDWMGDCDLYISDPDGHCS